MKKFSILIANYNNGKYFIDCYNSVINQTYENWEVIIVDDASTDNSMEIIHSMVKDDTRFKIYENITKKGCGFTKRKCLQHATGDICAYLDPDDALYPNAIECSVNELNKNNKIVATYSQLMFCDENLIPKRNFNKSKQIYNNSYFFNYPIQMGPFFAFVRKTYLQTSGINANLKSAVDQDLYLKILEYGNAKFIKNKLYKYRLHSNGISQGEHKESAKESFARVILDTMHRRGFRKINGKIIPETFDQPQAIFDLLEYQNSITYRAKCKIALIVNL